MYICPGLHIEQRVYLDISWRNNWRGKMCSSRLLSDEKFTEFEAWFDEFFEPTLLSDEELTELEALLYPERAEQQALIDEFSGISSSYTTREHVARTKRSEVCKL